MREGLTITPETAQWLRSIAGAPDDLDSLVEAADLDPEDFSRFLAAVGAARKPVARELLRAAKNRYQRDGRYSAARPLSLAGKPRLQQAYEVSVRDALQRQFRFRNPMQVPKLEYITVTVPVPSSGSNPKLLSAAADTLALISGQKPIEVTAGRAISNFGVRKGTPIGVEVTLRRERMWEFLDRFVNLALPRVPNFSGLSPRAFDGRGNYSASVKEHKIFPEVDHAQVAQVYPVDIDFVTSSTDDEPAYALLHGLGLPFRGEPVVRAVGVP